MNSYYLLFNTTSQSYNFCRYSSKWIFWRTLPWRMKWSFWIPTRWFFWTSGRLLWFIIIFKFSFSSSYIFAFLWKHNFIYCLKPIFFTFVHIFWQLFHILITCFYKQLKLTINCCVSYSTIQRFFDESIKLSSSLLFVTILLWKIFLFSRSTFCWYL